MMWWLFARTALACGGFFCDQVDPIEQTAERILFRHDGPDDWTTIVEVQFQGPPADFGWVIPIPQMLDPQTDITLAPAGLFDALDAVAGPQFVSGTGTADAAYMSAGCESGCGPGPKPDVSGVHVVGAAVVGPYDLEVIEATEGDNLVNWLQQAGYQIPFSAYPLFEGYIQEGYTFLGVKLLPDVPSGPIEALVLQCGAAVPSIPLRLTSVAAKPDMEIVAYVLAEERYRPDRGFSSVQIDPSRIVLEEDGSSDYLSVLGEAIDEAGGHTFRTESSLPASQFVHQLPEDIAAVLGQGAVLTRMRTLLDPEEMTLDPVFVPYPEGGTVSRILYVDAPSTAASALSLVWLAVFGYRRRS